MLNRRAEHRLASVLSREWGKQSLLFLGVESSFSFRGGEMEDTQATQLPAAWN